MLTFNHQELNSRKRFVEVSWSSCYNQLQSLPIPIPDNPPSLSPAYAIPRPLLSSQSRVAVGSMAAICLSTTRYLLLRTSKSEPMSRRVSEYHGYSTTDVTF